MSETGGVPGGVLAECGRASAATGGRCSTCGLLVGTTDGVHRVWVSASTRVDALGALAPRMPGEASATPGVPAEVP